MTSARRVIAAAIECSPGSFTVDDLIRRIRETTPSAGSTATVYRTVASMAESGVLTRVGTRNGSALYVRCFEENHHHHAVCEKCGKVAHLDCPLDMKAVAATGFTTTKHEIILYGLCDTCRGSGAVRSSAAGDGSAG